MGKKMLNVTPIYILQQARWWTHESEGGHFADNTAVAPHFTNPEGMEGCVNLGAIVEATGD